MIIDEIIFYLITLPTTIFRARGCIEIYYYTCFRCNVYTSFSRHALCITLYMRQIGDANNHCSTRGNYVFFLLTRPFAIMIGVYNPTYIDVCVWTIFPSRLKLRQYIIIIFHKLPIFVFYCYHYIIFRYFVFFKFNKSSVFTICKPNVHLLPLNVLEHKL